MIVASERGSTLSRVHWKNRVASANFPLQNLETPKIQHLHNGRRPRLPSLCRLHETISLLFYLNLAEKVLSSICSRRWFSTLSLVVFIVLVKFLASNLQVEKFFFGKNLALSRQCPFFSNLTEFFILLLLSKIPTVGSRTIGVLKRI